MKVTIRHNLLDKNPTCITIASDSIDDICRSIREIFKETGEYVYAETDENLAWTSGEAGAIIVSPKVKEDNSNDAQKGYENEKKQKN